MTRLTVLIFMLAVVSFAPASPSSDGGFVVSYVSIDHVYIDGGRARGIEVGDTVTKTVKGEIVARMEVEYVSMHSASCRVLDGSQAVGTGDIVTIERKMHSRETVPPASIVTNTPPSAPIAVPATPASGKTSVPVRYFGNVSLAIYRWNDNSDADLGFTQTSARFNFRVDNIWKKHATLTIRTRGRYDVRNSAYNTGSPEQEWRNRLWELSYKYHPPDARLGFTIGRFIPQHLGNIGFIDGGLLSVRLADNLQVAMMAGRRPEWAYGEIDHALERYGSYVFFRHHSTAGATFEQTFGAVGEFHGSIPSRTFLAWRGVVRRGTSLGLSHSVELDINSGWRRERVGHRTSLSNLYIQTWVHPRRDLRFSVQYDNRQKYWYYELISEADSLFDDRIRRGIRGSVDVALLAQVWLHASLGYRKTSNETKASISYSASLRKSGFFGYSGSLLISAFQFDGVNENGFGYNARLQLPPVALVDPYIGTGGYSYSAAGSDGYRRSTSLELGATLDLSRKYFISHRSEWSWGDDIEGLRTTLEIGYRY
ncbi:MAG: hypothetical protein AB1483_00520 [Candidatus Zixiibacteriota bacterium]